MNNEISEYMGLAKKVTDSLYDLTKHDEEITFDKMLGGIGMGVYMFLRYVASRVDGVEVSDLYKEVNRWMEWSDSKFNKKGEV